MASQSAKQHAPASARHAARGTRHASEASILVARAKGGEIRALARLLTLLEGEWDGGASEAMPLLAQHAGRAHVVGVTGPPGAGKSTLVDRLVGAFRETGERVAVLAFDPSSPFTGGAILGDRVRMGDRALDPGVYIRSVANRAHAGGLSRTAARLVTALDAAGFQRILLETVGAGQSEVDVAGLAHTVVVVLAPGFGDEIQALKAGLLETPDLLVVNKADLPGADRVAASLQEASVGRRPAEPCLFKVSAAKGDGIAELAAAIQSHAAALRAGSEWGARRRANARELLVEAVRDRLWRRFQSEDPAALARVLEQVQEGSLDPESAAALLVKEA